MKYAALILLAACGGAPADVAEPADDVAVEDVAVEPAGEADAETPAARAARIATAIRANPGEAASILEAEGLDEDAFEAMLFEIAADPEASAAYRAGM